MILLMNTILVYVVLIITGLCFGSFAGATMWRIKARSLRDDKRSGYSYDKESYKKLHKLIGVGLFKDRSQCLNCSYELKWYDLIPVISWVSLGGRCRKCRQSIGWLELIIELSVMLFFVLSFMFWPSLSSNAQIIRLVIWLIAGVGLAISFAYDAKWAILPDVVTFPVIGLGVINTILVIATSSDKVMALVSVIGAILILSGLYQALYTISNGRWVGYGDVKLGLALALLLADWKLAFIALFLANLVGCLIVFPHLITKKLKRGSHVPFGPLLIIGFVISGLFGNYLIDIYLSYML